MRVYLVRHGESKDNALKVFQTPEVGLSALGIKQSKKLAKKLSKLPVDLILSSSYERAKQTALIVNNKINKKVIFSNLLVELKRPSEFVGKFIFDEDLLKIKEHILEHWGDPKWHYSNEENFFDFKKRAENFFKYLENFNEKNILVITHGHFMRMLISVILFRNDLTPKLFDDILSFFKIENSGISVIEKDEDGKWYLLTWNDYAHL